MASGYERHFGRTEILRLRGRPPGDDPEDDDPPPDARYAAGERSQVVTRLPFEWVSRFAGDAAGATQVRDIVFRLMWDPAGDVLNEAEMRNLLDHLFKSASPMSGDEVTELFASFAPLTPRRLSVLVLNLFEVHGVIPRSQRWHDIRPWTQAPNPLTAQEFEVMVNHLRRPAIVDETLLTRADMFLLFDEMLPSEGSFVNTIFVRLCQPGVASGMTGYKFNRFIRWMRDAPGHALELTLAEIEALVTDLRTNPGGAGGDQINGSQIYQMLKANLDMPEAPVNFRVNPREFRDMIRALRAQLHPRNLQDFIAGRSGLNQGIMPLYTRWLFEAATAVGTDFVNKLNNTVTRAQSLASLRAILARISRVWPSAWGVRFLDAFVALHGMAPAPDTRFQSFLNEMATAQAAGRATWVQIQGYLNSFLLAGRAPHGAANRKYARTGMHGIERGRVNGHILRAAPNGEQPSAAKVYLSDERLNHICNAHTFAHCNFTARLAPALMAVQTFEFWPHATGRAGVIGHFQGIPIGALVRSPDTEQVHGGMSFRVSDLGWRVNLFLYQIHHLSPGDEHRIHRDVLSALRHLFDEVNTQ